MIDLEFLKNFYPATLWQNVNHRKYILKEYIQLLLLEFLTTTPYVKKVVFIGGTCLRFTKGIDRFSEDLDFDCKKFSEDEFIKMTDDMVVFLKRYGWNVELRERPGKKLSAFRRNLYFPGLLFDLGLSGHKEERFLIKIESQDQEVEYQKEMAIIKGCGMFFKFPVPLGGILCSMKILALLQRKKGRDFYDVMFLMSQQNPDYHFLNTKYGISHEFELKSAFLEVLESIDLKHKAKDFEHLAFNQESTKKILLFREFVEDL